MERDNSINNVILIRYLDQEGYREKIIKMITGLNQSYINKIIRRKLHRYVEYKPEIPVVMSDEQRKRFETANKILECRELPTNEMEQDVMYMKLLRFFLVEKEDIYDIYNHWTKTKINRLLLKRDVDILQFNSELLGIPRRDYLDLIIDEFLG